MAKHRSLQQLMSDYGKAKAARVVQPSAPTPAAHASPFDDLKKMVDNWVREETPAPAVIAAPVAAAPRVVETPKQCGPRIWRTSTAWTQQDRLAAAVEERRPIAQVQHPLISRESIVKDHGRRFCNGRAIAHFDTSDRFSVTTDENDESLFDTFGEFWLDDNALAINVRGSDASESESEEDPYWTDSWHYYGRRRHRAHVWFAPGVKAEMRRASQLRKLEQVRQQFSHGRSKSVRVSRIGKLTKAERAARLAVIITEHRQKQVVNQSPQNGRNPSFRKYGGVHVPQLGKTHNLRAMQQAVNAR